MDHLRHLAVPSHVADLRGRGLLDPGLLLQLRELPADAGLRGVQRLGNEREVEALAGGFADEAQLGPATTTTRDAARRIARLVRAAPRRHPGGTRAVPGRQPRRRSMHQRATPDARGHDAPARRTEHHRRVSSPPTTRPMPAVPQDGRVVVLVEDDRSLRVAIGRLLRASGFVSRAYPSAEAALADPAAEQADCLVVDLNLPAMSGLDLLERLRARGVTAPAVAITAADTARVRADIRRRGVQHLLAKPFGGPELVELLERLLASQAVSSTPSTPLPTPAPAQAATPAGRRPLP